MAASDAEPDPARRMQLLAEAERLLVEEDFPVLPIFHYVQLYLYDPHRLTGITSHPRQDQELQELDINPLTVLPKGVRALDVRARVERPRPPATTRRVRY